MNSLLPREESHRSLSPGVIAVVALTAVAVSVFTGYLFYSFHRANIARKAKEKKRARRRQQKSSAPHVVTPPPPPPHLGDGPMDMDTNAGGFQGLNMAHFERASRRGGGEESKEERKERRRERRAMRAAAERLEMARMAEEMEVRGGVCSECHCEHD
jgi:hypothetical protein